MVKPGVTAFVMHGGWRVLQVTSGNDIYIRPGFGKDGVKPLLDG